tara:strand:+ start:2267 stop:2713 length:447 start_codon:yes stop_codon:yes gene_type:complete
MALYTLIFNFYEGTYLSQHELSASAMPDVNELIGSWLAHLKGTTTTLAGQVDPPISVMEYFDSLIDWPKSFEEQVRQEIANGETLTALDSIAGGWGIYFTIVLSAELNTRSDPDAEEHLPPGMGELYVVQTAGGLRQEARAVDEGVSR